MILVIGLMVTGHSAVNGQTTSSPATVERVDLQRYVGLWYEIAKIPNTFQRKCAGGTTAQYELRQDGRIAVVNRCIKSNGEAMEAKGIAKIVDAKTNAKLKVSFVNLLGWRPFWGDYWIIGLDENYRWAVVGHPQRKYGWILGRTPTLEKPTMEAVFKLLREQSYDPNDFEMTHQE